MTFNLNEQIGEMGGFGKVYRCTDELGNSFACKMLENNSELAIRRFEREIRLISRLNHPNVIKLIAYNISDTSKSYIMPLYKCSLKHIIPNIVNNVYSHYCIINAILNGVLYLHSEGVLHRDLKPDNILYNNDNDIVITDFGLGIQNDSNSTTLTEGINFGTRRYCSPEQMYDMHLVDERTDIFAIGKIIEDIVTNNLENPITDLALKYVIDKCTKMNREDRFNSVEELKKVIDMFYGTLLGWSQNASLDEMLLQLETNQISRQDVIQIANQVIKVEDKEKIELFFRHISDENYKLLERDSGLIVKDLVEKLCNYWNQTWWPFSYIDNISDLGEKIYNISQNAEVKAEVLFTLMNLAIDYNRWYAMGCVKRMFGDLNKDNATQVELAIRLQRNRLSIYSIFESEVELPALIRDIYKNG